MIGPDSPNEDKHRHLRALYRQHDGGLVRHAPGKVSIDAAQQAECRRILEAEYERLYGEPTSGGALEEILATAWAEADELAGIRWDHTAQRRVGPDGKPLKERGHG